MVELNMILKLDIKWNWCGFIPSIYIYLFYMIFKGLLVVLLATAVFAYEKEGNVLVLHDADFPQVIQEHDYIMIEFYAPW